MSVTSIISAVSAAEQQGPSTQEAQKPELRENLTPEEKTFYGLLKVEYEFLTNQIQDDDGNGYILDLKQACIQSMRWFEKDPVISANSSFQTHEDITNIAPEKPEALKRIGLHMYRNRQSQYERLKFKDTSAFSDDEVQRRLTYDYNKKEKLEQELMAISAVLVSLIDNSEQQ